MRRSSSIVRLIILALVALVAVPSTVLAAPSEESCASSRAVPFSTGVPDALRTVGTHRFEWYSTVTFADGTTGEGLNQNQVTISSDAPIYPNTVLLRLVRNTTQLADGSVIEVPVMNPAQSAQFYVAAFSIKSDEVFLGSFRTWLRYETSKNHWTPFVELARGPVTNYCTQVTNAAWKKSYGWA